MKNSISIFMFVCIIFLMPFLLVSCNENDISPGHVIPMGYSIGFPAVILSFFINPLRNITFYPSGLLDILFIVAVYFIVRFMSQKKNKIEYCLIHGWKWMCGYIIGHLVYNIIYPIYFSYSPEKWSGDSGIMGGQIAYAVIFPFLYGCDNVGIELDLSKTLMSDLRVNFFVACLIYFLIGTFFFIVTNKIKSINKS